MLKYQLTIGLFDKDTETQLINTNEGKNMISNILINKYNIFAFTMIECSGVYKMSSTNKIVFELSIRIEVASDEAINVDTIITDLKFALNQESIMLEISEGNIFFQVT